MLKRFLGTARTKAANSLREQATAAQSRQDWATAYRLWSAWSEANETDLNARLQIGNMLNELGRHGEAIAAFEAAMMIDPQAVEISVGIAGVYDRMGNWPEAFLHWNEAIIRMAFAGQSASEHFVAVCLSAARAAINTSEHEKALLILDRLTAGRAAELPVEAALLRAQATKHASPEVALALIADYIRQHPADRTGPFELASISLQTGDYARGLQAISPLLRATIAERSVLWLAVDLHERLGDWTNALAQCERCRLLAPDDEAVEDRCFDLALRCGNLQAARKYAAHDARRGEWDRVSRLIEPYRTDGQLDHARLLCRWLCRVWPHSRWHAAEYILLTAISHSLEQADRLIRASIATGESSSDLLGVYASAPFHTGNYTEAVRRIRFLLETQASEDLAVLLGYAIANASGLDEAEAYFAQLAARTFQSQGALVGLAHMSMRRRDLNAIYERWLRVTLIHEDYDIGHVELARAAYGLRRIALAKAICANRLAVAPNDVTIAEFQCWLFIANGELADARSMLHKLDRFGPSWTVAELLVHASSQLGRLDTDLEELLKRLPSSTTQEASHRLYGIVRHLDTARRRDLVSAVVGRTNIEPSFLGWLTPYLSNRDSNGARWAGADIARNSWTKARTCLRTDVGERIRIADPHAVDEILGQERHLVSRIHIINKFEQPGGGSELHALDLGSRLSNFAEVRLWSPETPHPFFTTKRNVCAVAPADGVVPQGGVLVIIGVYFDIQSWIAHSNFSRVVILYNTFEAPMLFQRISQIFAHSGVRPELLFCSELMQCEVGLPGLFEPSPTNIEHFAPRTASRKETFPFVLGRHSRDVVEKHSFDDWKIYEAVSQLGGCSKILGGTCMAASFPDIRGLELLPAQSGDMVPFLHSLDCYFYRTSTWVEPWGRVVLEAMACGLPVVASRNGGYAQVIMHGQNGFLFETSEEAVDIIERLAGSRDLRQSIGVAARETACALLGETPMRRLLSFYLAS